MSTSVHITGGVVVIEQVKRRRGEIAALARRAAVARAATVAMRDQVLVQLAEVENLFKSTREQLDIAGELLAERQVALDPPQVRAGPSRTSLERLHAEYAATRDPAQRAELMEAYDTFARSLALKFRSRRETPEDLLQVARLGLLHSIDRFDPSMERPFPAFARITITGELKRHIRDKTWTMRVPRSLQEHYLNVMQALDELTAEHGESPSVPEVARHCGLTEEQVIEAMELGVSQRPLSLDVESDDGDGPVLDPGEEDTGYGRLEENVVLTGLLDRLGDRERQIVELRFRDDLSQSEIASRVGVSQMCVSRQLARTLGRLRVWARSAGT